MTSDWNTEAVTSEADTAHRHNAVQEIFLVHIDHHTISIINTSYGLQTDISILRVGLSMMTMSNKLEIIHVLRFIFHALGRAGLGSNFFSPSGTDWSNYSQISPVSSRLSCPLRLHSTLQNKIVPKWLILFRNMIKCKWSVLLLLTILSHDRKKYKIK